MVKICSKCKESKPITEFSKHSCSRDGLESSCKKCGKDYRIKNAIAIKTYSANYRAKNTEKIAAIQNKYRSENPEKIKIANEKHRNANKDKTAARSAAWEKANPEARRINKLNRRAKERAAGGKLSKDIAKRLFKLQRGKCPCCKKSLGDNYHRDHKMPLALGGANEDWNIQLLCPSCNLSKQAKHPIEFMQSRGFLI